MLSKNLLLFVAVVSIIVTVIFSFIGNFNYHKTAHTYQTIKQQGIRTSAYSTKTRCNKGRGLSATRLYRYVVNQKQYFIDTVPEDPSLDICDKQSLGDSITIYYLPSNPNIKLSETQLQQGVSSQISYYFLSIIFSIVFLAYWIGTKYSSYKECQKTRLIEK